MRGGGRAPPISGEYVALGPSLRPSAPEVLPPSGRYGAAPESLRELDDFDFDSPSQRAIELEDGHPHRGRSSLEPTSSAMVSSRVSHVSRVMAPLPLATRSMSSSRANLVVVGFFVAIGVASIMAGLWVVVALLAPA